LDNVFEAVVYHKDIFSGIEDGFLCDLRGLQVHLAADLDRVRTRGGDFIEGELSRELERADIPAAMVQAYARHAPARKALAYLPSVHLAARTAALFREAGIAAAAVSGKTPLEERRQTLRDLRCGSLRIVANCAVLVEGYDDPAADCILLGRPTKSRLLYTQITGRGARQHPGKHDCLIVDFVGATTRHDLVTLGDLFGLPLRLLEGRTVTEAKAEQAREEQERAAAEQRRLAAREVELLRRPAPAPRRPLHWAREGTIYALPLPRGCLAIHPVPGGYRAVRLEGRVVVEELTATPLPIDWAQGLCEDWARGHDAQHLSAPDTAWRAQPASDKQRATLRRMGKSVPQDVTKGAACDLISVTGAAWTLGRRRRV
jgi:hypothetical protein